MRHLKMHPPAKFDENQTIDNEMAAYFVKFKMAAAAIMDFSMYIWFRISSIGNAILNLLIKFRQNRSIFNRVIAICVNLIWPPPPS